jgi:hypothetical protein
LTAASGLIPQRCDEHQQLVATHRQARKGNAMPANKVAALPQSRAAKRRFRENFWEDFRAAVALDPDWDWCPDDSFCCAPDVLYDTPEKLVAAYRAWIGKARHE